MAAAEVTVIEPAMGSAKVEEVHTELLPVAMETDEKDGSEKRYVAECFQSLLPSTQTLGT